MVDTGSEMRDVRRHVYREKLDLSGKPLILLSGAPIESARELIPFLRPVAQMAVTKVSCDEIRVYNGKEADEIHEFSNITQAGHRLSRILVQEGIIIELAFQG